MCTLTTLRLFESWNKFTLLRTKKARSHEPRPFENFDIIIHRNERKKPRRKRTDIYDPVSPECHDSAQQGRAQHENASEAENPCVRRRPVTQNEAMSSVGSSWPECGGKGRQWIGGTSHRCCWGGRIRIGVSMVLRRIGEVNREETA